MVGPVAFSIIDDQIGSKALDVVHVARTGGGRHPGAGVLCELYGQGANSCWTSEYENFVALLDIHAIEETFIRGGTDQSHSSSLLMSNTGRLLGESGDGNCYVLSEGTAEGSFGRLVLILSPIHGENFVAYFQIRLAIADGENLATEIVSHRHGQWTVPRLLQPTLGDLEIDGIARSCDNLDGGKSWRRSFGSSVVIGRRDKLEDLVVVGPVFAVLDELH
mmetsp:Transcript_2415/g.4097  ORF Transcript_2415/g.4097 Transcript_2415/m.4097 type:complete len:220 (-) Transcript_2415:158-817(-)